jgi:hypothetical protein
VCRAAKTGLELGEWKSGHIPRSAFPLSRAKPKSYKFGPEYQWRVVKFQAAARNFRLLLLVNENKCIYRSTLAIEVEKDLAVL